jgi:hypothetical protein
MIPLKSVFRIYNPEEGYDEMMERLEKDMQKGVEKVDDSGAVGSATNLQDEKMI